MHLLDDETGLYCQIEKNLRYLGYLPPTTFREMEHLEASLHPCEVPESLRDPMAIVSRGTIQYQPTVAITRSIEPTCQAGMAARKGEQPDADLLKKLADDLDDPDTLL